MGDPELNSSSTATTTIEDPNREKLLASKILMVGAGGIGCELLKNLVLADFGRIDVIDLDTIDVSNLNRQFLFQKQHVGRSKAQVAVESVQAFNDVSQLSYFHASIQESRFDVNFFKEYDLVLNALDNRAARNHVNRLCLAADIPLIESGSAGYLGQVTLIKKGLTECYECTPKTAQRTYPGCTIRNTPSEPIHCIVWAKHLFNQLYGEADPDQDVSPDMSDPELQKESNGENGSSNGRKSPHSNSTGNNNSEAGNVQRVSTRKWAEENDYDPKMLFTKFFDEDIKYLLSMANLWKKRNPPEPLAWTDESAALPEQGFDTFEQAVWSIDTCRDIFVQSIKALQERAAETKQDLIWDKDDDASMNFVTACSNIRAHVFHIQMKSRFEIKSMAGNIIPAIATTNAIVAGLIVVEAIKVLTGRINECLSTFLAPNLMTTGKFLGTSKLDPPNPKCYVCSSKPEVIVELDCANFTVQALAEKVLKQRLNMIAPDVEFDDNSGRIIISSEEEETAELQSKTLIELGIQDGTRLRCDDFQQHYELRLIIRNSKQLPEGAEFEILTDTSSLRAEAEEQPGTSAAAAAYDDDEDDLVEIFPEEEMVPSDPINSKKRKADETSMDEDDVAKRFKAPK